MYLEFFGLVEKPFEYLIPNPRYFYYTEDSLGIKKQCDYIIKEKGGHLFISGPIGAGKTTLLKTLIQNLMAEDDSVVTFINAPNLKTSNALMRRIADGFKVKTERSYNDTLQNFTEWLKQTKHFPILIIDEGQNLSLDSLKTLHYLMTYVTDRLLLMILLCGQEELVLKINRFPAIKSRMFSAYLDDLDRKETEDMMKFRWSTASRNKESELPFTNEAIDVLYNYTKGNPRAICQVADIALLAAFTQGKEKIDEQLIHPVIRSLEVKEEKK